MRKRVRRLISNFSLFMASFGSRGHIIIQSVLGGIERLAGRLANGNVRQWKKGMLFFLNLYERFRNHNGNNKS